MTIHTGETPKAQTRKPRKRTTTPRRKKAWIKIPKAFQRNWGLYVIGTAVLASMDAFSAGVISLTNPITYPLFGVAIHLSIFEVIFCFGAGLLAFIGGTAIAQWKNDPRKEQGMRIFGARVLIVAILTIGPAPYFGKALTYVDRHGANIEYSGSKQEEFDKACLANKTACSEAAGEDGVAAAQERFKASTKPKHATLDPIWAIVAWLMYAAVVFSAEVFYVVAPETEGQRKERRTAERRAQRELEERTAEERIRADQEAERKRAQSLTHRFKAVIIDLFPDKRRDAA